MKYYVNTSFSEARIFPLSESNFPSLDDVKDYFDNQLPANDYKFDLLKMRFTCQNNSLIYFQYRGRLIASAVADAKTDNKMPIRKGTIRLFFQYGLLTKELGAMNVKDSYGKSIKAAIKRVAIRIDLESVPLIEKELSRREAVVTEANKQDIYLVNGEEPIEGEIEGKRILAPVSIVERSSKNRIACLRQYNPPICVVCGINLGEFYDPLNHRFDNRIHIHHINPIAGAGATKIDPIRDLVPVCPNCHYIIHLKGNGDVYSIAEMKAMIEARRNGNGLIRL